MSALLDRIGRLDPKLNVFIRLDAEAAMREARTAEAEIVSGGFVRHFHETDMPADPEVKAALEQVVGTLQTRGAEIRDVRLPSLD
jgi:Asp-tRNA(Asn)/Glu-tRNA(Gln) amidotransferase A subunit family amidase